MKEFEEIAKELIKELDLIGVKSYIWHCATTGSVYVRFEDNRIGSVRLGDHNGKDKLKYKFNIRSDNLEVFRELNFLERNHSCHRRKKQNCSILDSFKIFVHQNSKGTNETVCTISENQ